MLDPLFSHKLQEYVSKYQRSEIGWSLFPALAPIPGLFFIGARKNQFSVERARLELISIILSYLMPLHSDSNVQIRKIRFTTNNRD